MKAISIKQPFGTLICCGLKDVENRSWEVKSTPMRVLIHVGASRIPMDETNCPLCWYGDIDNYQQMGILPPLKSLPKSAIVGVATIERCDTRNPSVWAQSGHGAEYKWVMTNAKWFKKPIMGVKGKLGFFDVPEICEDNLPECIDVVTEQRNGKHLLIPMARQYFDQLASGECNAFEMFITDRNKDVFVDDEMDALETESVTLYCEGETKTFDNPKLVTFIEDDDNSNPVVYRDEQGRKAYLWKINIDL